MSPIRFKKFDARPVVTRGEEPYLEIRKHLDALSEDQGLVVVAPFLPAPLIEKLGGEGFKSKAERGEDGSWITYFWRESN